jgi:hypothetical protein
VSFLAKIIDQRHPLLTTETSERFHALNGGK